MNSFPEHTLRKTWHYSLYWKKLRVDCARPRAYNLRSLGNIQENKLPAQRRMITNYAYNRLNDAGASFRARCQKKEKQ